MRESVSVNGAGVKDIEAFLLCFGIAKLKLMIVRDGREIICYYSKDGFAKPRFGGCRDDELFGQGV
jgi:hypothetical protein